MNCTKKKCRSFRRLLVGALLPLCLIGLAGCDDDDNGDDQNLLPEVSADMLTSATPGIPEYQLDETHTGWANRSCLDAACHTGTHVSGYRPPECSHCHGTNGAPIRLSAHDGAAHPDTGCTNADCHPDQHPGEDLESPNDCRGCHRYEKLSAGACTHTEDYDVVIVGGGGGALSAASVLSKKGLNVLVLEQGYKVGGCMVNFYRNDYRIEASLHAMEGIGLIYLEQLGIIDKLEPVAGDHLYRAVVQGLPKGSYYDIPANVEEYRTDLKSMFPDSAEDIDRIFDDMLATTSTMDFSAFANMNTVEMMQKYNIEDEALFTLITSLAGFIAGGLDQVPAGVYAGMWNAFHNMSYNYFVGGSQAITDALVDVIDTNGGTIKTYAMVNKIVIQDGKAVQVQTQEGGCYNARYVISNANESDTYNKLVGAENLPDGFLDELNARSVAPTITAVYLGVNKDYSEYFPGTGHEYMVFPDYRLVSENIEANACRSDIRGMNISNYSILDPTAAPPGKSVINLTAAMGWECNDEWQFNKSWADYKAYKWKIASDYIKQAEEYLPNLSRHIEVVEVGSPQTIRAYTLNPRGAWAGWGIPQDLSSPLDLMAEDRHLTPFPNLFLAGVWATGGGQSLVLGSGTIAAKLILKQEGLAE